VSKPRGMVPLALLLLLVGYGCAEPDAPGILVFNNVRAFDGEQTRERVRVIVENGLIRDVGTDLRIPAKAHVIEGEGQTLLPGLIDAHAHPGSAANSRVALVFGVTTGLDMGAEPKRLAAIKSGMLEGGAHNYADVFSSGSMVTSSRGYGTQYYEALPTLDREEDADAFVTSLVETGSDYIKIAYPIGSSERRGDGADQLTEPTMRAVVAAARRHGKLSVVHVNTYEAAREVAEGGASGLAHLFTDKVADEELTDLFIEKGVFVIPTLTVYEGLWGTSPWGAELANDPRVMPYLEPAEIGDLSSLLGGNDNQSRYELWLNMVESVRALHRKGVPILAGTDIAGVTGGSGYGVTLHRELESLVFAGLSPQEALASATSVPARIFGLDDRGRIAPGARADLVLVRGDPTVDITATRDIVGVWKQGVATDRAAVQEEAAALRRAVQEPGVELVIADFESGELRALKPGSSRKFFGVFSGASPGVESSADIAIVDGGAAGSTRSLAIRGLIAEPGESAGDNPRYWGEFAGPNFVIGVVDLSAKSEITFWARGEGDTYRLFLFSEDQRFSPAVQTFVAGPDWAEFRYPLSSFSGIDVRAFWRITFSGGPDPGPFAFQIDDVRVR